MALKGLQGATAHCKNEKNNLVINLLGIGRSTSGISTSTSPWYNTWS